MTNNPIIWADYPDLDPIRVGDTYYMVSTTMHMMPGCVILRSYDLAHWEVATHVYDELDNTPAQRLEGTRHIYGKGMWAASLRHHNNRFYLCFVANDTHTTYLFTSDNIMGPWVKTTIEGFYHDCSLLFDDDGRVFIVYGNAQIRLTELKEDLSGPKPGGLDRVIIQETEEYLLGYEGAHFYKINGKYVVFLIHILKSGNRRRTQACFIADSPEGEFVGGEVFDDDMGYFNSGVAQGGIVDTPAGDWYALLFQDHGAVGRIPVLVPVRWENGWPVHGVHGKAPHQLELPSTRPGYQYKPLVSSDDFSYTLDRGKVRLNDVWQWNHTPDSSLWSVTEKPNAYRVRSGKLCSNINFAVNTLTQRAMGPACETEVMLDGSELNDGDYAGLCLLISTFGLIALTREGGSYFLVMRARVPQDKSMMGNLVDDDPGTEFARVAVGGPVVSLRARCDFVNNNDTCEFFYQTGGQWIRLGITHKMYYKLDHFMGCRFGLFLYSTEKTGGVAEFSKFQYNML